MHVDETPFYPPFPPPNLYCKFCFISSEMCLWDISDGRCVETTKLTYTHSCMQVLLLVLSHDYCRKDQPHDWANSFNLNAWVKVFRIIPEFRILTLTFHRKSASKC